MKNLICPVVWTYIYEKSDIYIKSRYIPFHIDPHEIRMKSLWFLLERRLNEDDDDATAHPLPRTWPPCKPAE